MKVEQGFSSFFAQNLAKKWKKTLVQLALKTYFSQLIPGTRKIPDPSLVYIRKDQAKGYKKIVETKKFFSKKFVKMTIKASTGSG